jgi:gliding motility-associated-like protein
VSQPLCAGNTGAVTLTATAGVAPYNYAMSSGAWSSTNVFSGLAAGTYVFHIKGSNQCTKDTTITIVNPLPAMISASAVSPMCNGMANGSVNLLGYNATGPFTYAMGVGSYSPSNIFSGLAQGTYLFHVKDANGCIKDTVITLTDSIHLGAIVSAPAILCNGGASPVLISGTGSPSGSYTYAYNSSAFVPTGTFSLTAGTYTLHVRDIATCHFDTAITIIQPPAGIVSVTPTNVNCNGTSTGSVTVIASGGTPSYLYNISGGAFGSSPVFGSLPAGTYVAQVKDAHGCTYSNSVVVSQPPPIILDSVSVTKPLCFGNTGSLHIYALGGTLSLGYALGSGGYSPSGIMSGLTAGTYLLHVRDANGCTKDTTVTITQPSAITPHAIVRSPMCSTVANGQVTLSGIGGTPAYSYALGGGSYSATPLFGSLSAGTYLFHVKDANGCIKDTTITLTDSIHLGAIVSAPAILCYGGSSLVLISGTGSPAGSYTYAYNSSAFVPTGTFSLTAGAYTLHVRDVSTCHFDTAITITQPPAGMVSAMLTNVNCNGAATGSITVLASGGTPSYLYNISGSAFGSAPVFGSLPAGTYAVQVKDAHGCIYSNSVVVSQPPPIVLDSVSVTRPLCFGNTGSLHIYAHGGTASLGYALGSGGYSPSGIMSGLPAGTCLLHVRDANGCTKDTTVTITQPSAIIPHAIVRSPVCNTLANGQITLSASGGTPAYTYALGTGSYGSATIFAPLAAGTYTFHIKDVNGCSRDTTIVLTDSLHITASATVSPELCFGAASGTITVAGSGGSAPYTYAIGTGLYGTGSLFSGLGSATYVVHVRDHNGCIKDTTAFIAQPTKLGLHISVTAPTCYGYTNGVVIATASGGSPAYLYALNTGAFTSSGTFSSVAAGAAHVQVKDVNGCLHDTTFNIHQPSPLYISVSPKNISCYGANDGSLTVSGSGGAMPYRYSVNSSAWQTGGTFTGLNAGSYSILVNDSNNCAVDTTDALYEPWPLTAMADIINPTCDGYKDGAVTIHAMGGTRPFAYAETGATFQIDSVFHRLDDGTYQFDIKDANGCAKKVSVDLKGYPHMKANIDTWPTSCFGGSDGKLKVYASGVAPFAYSNDGGVAGIEDTFAHLRAGMYTITVIDSNGCRKAVTATITQPQPLAITFTVADNKCDGYEDQGAIKADVTGGMPPYQYAWSNDVKLNAPVNAPLANGHYGLVVTDSNKCVLWDSTSVKYASCCRPYIPNAFTPNGDGKNDIFSIGHTGDMIILDFRIYNRFGEEVYYSTDPSSGWNGYYKGIKAELGVYYYYARIICGNDRDDKVIFLKGDVTLIQ